MKNALSQIAVLNQARLFPNCERCGAPFRRIAVVTFDVPPNLPRTPKYTFRWRGVQFDEKRVRLIDACDCPSNQTFFLPCPGGCNHTHEQHVAFDSGVIVGRQRGIEREPRRTPYNEPELIEAFRTGFSVGALEYVPKPKKARKKATTNG